jgi:hypothetical protein
MLFPTIPFDFLSLHFSGFSLGAREAIGSTGAVAGSVSGVLQQRSPLWSAPLPDCLSLLGQSSPRILKSLPLNVLPWLLLGFSLCAMRRYHRTITPAHLRSARVVVGVVGPAACPPRVRQPERRSGMPGRRQLAAGARACPTRCDE